MNLFKKLHIKTRHQQQVIEYNISDLAVKIQDYYGDKVIAVLANENRIQVIFKDDMLILPNSWHNNKLFDAIIKDYFELKLPSTPTYTINPVTANVCIIKF